MLYKSKLVSSGILIETSNTKQNFTSLVMSNVSNWYSLLYVCSLLLDLKKNMLPSSVCKPKNLLTLLKSYNL